MVIGKNWRCGFGREFHNDVREADERRKRRQSFSLLRRQEGAGPGIANEVDAIKVLWPTLNACVTCFKLDGSWNEPAVFRHLEKTYW